MSIASVTIDGIGPGGSIAYVVTLGFGPFDAGVTVVIPAAIAPVKRFKRVFRNSTPIAATQAPSPDQFVPPAPVHASISEAAQEPAFKPLPQLSPPNPMGLFIGSPTGFAMAPHVARPVARNESDDEAAIMQIIRLLA